MVWRQQQDQWQGQDNNMNHQIPMMNMTAGNQNIGQENMNGEMNDTIMQMNVTMGDNMNVIVNSNMDYVCDGYLQFRAEDNICATNNIKCFKSTPSKHEYHKSTSTYSHAANSLLKTINFNLEDIK